MMQHYGKRKLKKEFFVYFAGFVFRRFPRRIYIQLPDIKTRIQLLKHLLIKQEHNLTANDFEWIAK
jgi:SpoVK/Ycf46/Vps4 family AAA+-type ATPase